MNVPIILNLDPATESGLTLSALVYSGATLVATVAMAEQPAESARYVGNFDAPAVAAAYDGTIVDSGGRQRGRFNFSTFTSGITVTPPSELQPLPADPNHAGEKWQNLTIPARFITADQFARHISLDRDGSNAPNSGGTSDDELLSYVDAAVDYVENAIEASLAPRTIRATFQCCRDMILPRGPVIGVTSIVDATGTTISDFTTEAVGRKVRVKVRHARAPISITYTAGHTNVAITGDGETPVIPASIVLVILNYAAMLYANREAATDKPITMLPHVEAFLRARRRGTGVG